MVAKMISKKMVKFSLWKTLKSHGKVHGKSWNFKSPRVWALVVVLGKMFTLTVYEWMLVTGFVQSRKALEF